MDTDTSKAPPGAINECENIRELAELALRSADLMDAALNLPRLSEVPRPGETRNWTSKEWGDWMTRYGTGMGEREETKHQFRWRHQTFEELILGIAKTPGDYRGTMNSCADFRAALIAVHETVRPALKHIAAGYVMPPDALSAQQDAQISLVDRLVKVVPMVLRSMPARLGDDPDRTIGDVLKVLDNAVNSGVAPSRTAALNAFMESTRREGDRVLFDKNACARMLAMPPSHACPAGLVDKLLGWLRDQRSIAEAERAALREQRSAEKAQRQKEKSTREPTPKELHDERVNRVRVGLGNQIEPIIDMMRKVMTTALNIEVPFPEAAVAAGAQVPDLEAKLAAVTQERDDLKLKADANQQVFDEATAAVAAQTDELARLRKRNGELEGLLTLLGDVVFEKDWAELAVKLAKLRERVVDLTR